MSPRPRIAIAFYGITRSLHLTYPSIESNLLTPSRSFGHCDVYCHFFDQQTVANTRTGEHGQLDPDEWRLLNADHASITPVQKNQEDTWLTQLKPFGNAWEDDWQSLRNIVRQQLSLQKVSDAIVANGTYDYVIFARPDMEYHDALNWTRIAHITTPRTITIPHWQWSGGLNDRFAICGNKAFRHYSHRLNMALRYCASRQRPLHSERLLFFALMHSPIWLRTTSLRATRVRSNGDRAQESFTRVKQAKIIEAFLACNVYSSLHIAKDWLTTGFISRQQLPGQ